MHESRELWSFMICKEIIKDIGRPTAPDVRRNWRKCLRFLASQVGMTAEDMFNTITPREFMDRLGMRQLTMWDCGGRYSRKSYPERTWYIAGHYRDARKASGLPETMLPLPGKD